MSYESPTDTGSHEILGEEFGVEIGNTMGLFEDLLKSPLETVRLPIIYHRQSLDPTYEIFKEFGDVYVQKSLKIHHDQSWKSRYANVRNAPERNAIVYSLNNELVVKNEFDWNSWSNLKKELDRLGLITHEFEEMHPPMNPDPYLAFDKYQHLVYVRGRNGRYNNLELLRIRLDNWNDEWFKLSQEVKLGPDLKTHVYDCEYKIPASQTLPVDLTNEANLLSSLHDFGEVIENIIRASYAIKGKQLPSTKFVINYKDKQLKSEIYVSTRDIEDETKKKTHENIESEVTSYAGLHATCGYCRSYYDDKQIEVRDGQMIIHDPQCHHCSASMPELLQTRSNNVPLSRKPRERHY